MAEASINRLEPAEPKIGELAAIFRSDAQTPDVVGVVVGRRVDTYPAGRILPRCCHIETQIRVGHGERVSFVEVRALVPSDDSIYCRN